MNHSILTYLRDHDGATVEQLTEATGMTAEAIRHILTGLCQSSFIIGLSRPSQAPIFRAVTRLGECGWCGLVDHHLVAEMCGPCLAKSSGLESLPTQPMRVRLPVPAVTATATTQRSHA